jgi:2-methylaconitate cis-trans-isomerase PrpF
MGLGDATGKVLPKVALLAPPARGGSISSRYLTPWTCHAAHAVTGALCVAAACRVRGSVAARITVHERDTGTIAIEHPAGRIETRVEVDATATAGDSVILRAGVVRTARLLLAGRVFVNLPNEFPVGA